MEATAELEAPFREQDCQQAATALATPVPDVLTAPPSWPPSHPSDFEKDDAELHT